MKPFSIRTKLFTGFGVVLAVMVLISTFSFYFNVKTNHTYQELLDNEVAVAGLVKSMNINIEKEHSMVTEYLLTSDEKFLNAYYDAKQSFFGNVQKLNGLVADGDDWQQLQALDLLQEFFSAAVDQMFDAKKENNSVSYMKTLAEQGDTIEAFTDIASQLVERNQSTLNQGVESASAEARSIQYIMWGVVAAGFLIGVVLSYVIGRAVSSPIIKLREAAAMISAGDLTGKPVTISNKDEIGQLADAFNNMSSSLRQILMEVNMHAEQVAASSEELTAGSEQTSQASEHIAHITERLAQGTEKQVESVHSSLLKVNEMDQAAEEIANSAKEVAHSADEASRTVQEGSSSIVLAVNQMTSIHHTVTDIEEVVRSLIAKSEEINRIAGFITDIAGQTNLLSLNAAIEAARAGEAGRGFAVVAGEVRKLSEQTNQFGKSITGFINDILLEVGRTAEKVTKGAGEVKEGIEIVQSAGQSFQSIEMAMEDVLKRIGAVTETTDRLSLNSNNLVHVFNEITHITESAADGTQGVSAAAQEQLATMEEISSSSKALAGLSEELLILTSRFKL